MRSGWSSASIFWVLLAWGRFPVSKAIIPDAQEHFLTPSAHRDTHLFGGLGVRNDEPIEAALLHQSAFFVLRRDDLSHPQRSEHGVLDAVLRHGVVWYVA